DCLNISTRSSSETSRGARLGLVSALSARAGVPRLITASRLIFLGITHSFSEFSSYSALRCRSACKTLDIDCAWPRLPRDPPLRVPYGAPHRCKLHSFPEVSRDLRLKISVPPLSSSAHVFAPGRLPRHRRPNRPRDRFPCSSSYPGGGILL